MTDVQIIWPATLPSERLDEAAEELTSAGVSTTCRIQPVRRGAESAVLILMATSVLEPLLKSVFQRLGEEAYDALKRFVGRLTGGPAGDRRADAPDIVIFESMSTGAQFLFTSGLPDDAFRAAVELDPGEEPGRWLWDAEAGSWKKFENQRS